MKLLFIAQRIPYPANKGEKIRTFNQIKYLADAGHQVTIIAPIESAEEEEFCLQLNQFPNINCEVIPLSHKILRLSLGLVKNEPLSVANFFDKKLQNQVNHLIKHNNFDAIICTSSAVAKYLFNNKDFAQLSKNHKLLMDFMDLDSDKWQQYNQRSRWPMNWVYQREANLLFKYEQKIQQTFDACFFIADAEVNLFQEKLSTTTKNVHTLGNGLNTSEFYPAKQAPQNAAPKFIFTGVMDYKPNIDAVLWFVDNCWSQIRTQYPEAEFIIAGMNPTSAINNLANQSGIIVTGFVDEILPYYHQADYFVAPFRLARGVQNKILQAFACGLPVISTPMGAEGINCRDNQEILLANSPEQFIQQINKLEQDAKLKSTLKDNALQLIEKDFSWSGKLSVLSQLLEA